MPIARRLEHARARSLPHPFELVVDLIAELAWTLEPQCRRRLAPEGLHGRRKMTALDRRSLPEASPDSVDRGMRLLGLSGVLSAKGVRTTIQAKDGKRVGDLLNRDFTATAPNRVWVTDFVLRPLLGRLGVRRVHPGRLLPTHRGLARGDQQGDRPGRGAATDGAVGTRDREGHRVAPAS